MISVAFLPENDVIPAWEKFIEHSETLKAAEQRKFDRISYFVSDYFEKKTNVYADHTVQWNGVSSDVQRPTISQFIKVMTKEEEMKKKNPVRTYRLHHLCINTVNT